MNYFKLLADVTFAWKVSHSQRGEEHSLPAIRGTKEGSEGVVSRINGGRAESRDGLESNFCELWDE